MVKFRLIFFFFSKKQKPPDFSRGLS